MKIWMVWFLIGGMGLFGDSFPSLSIKNQYKKFDDEGIKNDKKSSYSPSLLGLKAEMAELKGAALTPLLPHINKSPALVQEAFTLRLIGEHYKKGRFDAALQGLSTIQSSILLANDTLVENLYKSIPNAQKKALVDIIEKNGFLDTKPSPCPYFELPARKERASLLKLFLARSDLSLDNRQKIWRELYIDKPEVFSDQELLVEQGFFPKNNFTFDDYLLRAENLLLFGKNDDAVKTISSQLSDQESLSPENQCRALYTLAKIKRKKKSFADARESLKSLIKRCDGEVLLKSRFLFLTISTILKDKETLPLFDAFVNDYKEHSFSDDVLFLKAKLLYETENLEDALVALKQVNDQYPSGDMYFKALFLRGFFYAQSNRSALAIEIFEKMAVEAKKNSSEFFQALYWKNRLKIAPDLFSFKKVVLKKNIEKELLDLVFAQQSSVYSWLAFDLLRECGKKIPKPKAQQKPATTYKVSDKALGDIEQLIRFGFRREALALLSEISLHKLTEDDVVMFAHYFDVLNRVELAHRKVIHCYQRANLALMEKDPALYERLAFPRIYEAEIKEAIKNTSVSPEYLYAIMKNESGFISDALSWAQARGLLQIMMPTANEAARRLKMPAIKEDDLFNPALNLKLGAHIFDNYIKRYGLMLGIAAYNAGPVAVKKWQKSKEVPADTVMELISFPETLHYSKNILSAIWTYYQGSSKVVPPLFFSSTIPNVVGKT